VNGNVQQLVNSFKSQTVVLPSSSSTTDESHSEKPIESVSPISSSVDHLSSIQGDMTAPSSLDTSSHNDFVTYFYDFQALNFGAEQV